MSRLKTWSDIVQEVESSGNSSLRVKNQEDNIRKQAYRNLLLQQINSHKNNITNYKQTTKNSQKQHIASVQRLNTQQLSIQQTKRSRMNQQYISQNLQMIKNKQTHNSQQKLSQIQLARRNVQNPFGKKFKQQEDERRTQQNRKLEQNYKLNQILGKQKLEIKKQEKEKQMNIGEQYQKYMSDVELKRKKEREVHLQKYIMRSGGIGNGDRGVRNTQTPVDSLDRQFSEYMSMNQNGQNNRNITKSNNKFYNDEIDVKAQKINENLVVDSKPVISPAFLGKITENDDRRRQLTYLNRNLGLPSKHTTNNKQVNKTTNPQEQTYHHNTDKLQLLPITSNHKTIDHDKAIDNYKTADHNKTINQGYHNAQYPKGTQKYQQRYNILTHRRQFLQ